MLQSRFASERGAVAIIMAIWLPVLAALVMFAVDTAHWWDYSRNLQIRADAAALAGGDQIGGTCFSASPSPGSLAKIGQVAQLYSGGDATLSDLYPYTPPTGIGIGFPGSLLSPGPNAPNLKAGTLDHFHVLLNSTRYWQTGDPSKASSSLSFSMGSFCNATDEDGNTGPIVDVRVTQDHLRLLFPLSTLKPTISAHARVELQQANAEKLVRAIAVRDPTPKCVYVNFRYASGASKDQIYKTVTLSVDATGDPTNPSATLFDNAGVTNNVDMSQGPFYVQPFLSDDACGAASPGGTMYDSSTNSGLLYINTFGSGTPGATEKPQISTDGVSGGTGGVLLTGPPCSVTNRYDQYFATQACTVGVTANVAFSVKYTDAGNKVLQLVTATDTSTGAKLNLSKLQTQVNGNQNNIPAGGQLKVDSTAGFAATGSIDVDGASYVYTGKDATHFTLQAGGSFSQNHIVTQTGDNRWTSTGGFAIGTETGQHPISISWEQQGGSITTLGTCTSTGTNPCTGNFGVQQQAFGACNGCDPPDDSGPIVAVRLRLQSDTAGTSGREAFANGANPSLTVEVVSQALTYDTPSTPAHILRVSVQTDKATGLLNCGQGTGANAVSNAIQFGCPLVNTAQCQDTNYCAPFKIYDPSLHPLGVCNPLSRAAGSAFADCVATNSENGTKRQQVVGAIADRIVAANGDCQANYWADYAADPLGHPIQGDTDPRALTFVITAPADLSSNSLTVPIRNFSTFYITGWDTGGGARQCTNAAKVVPNGGSPNEAFPGSGKDKQLGAIWGHWIQYTDPNAIGNGTPGCPPSFFGVCVPVLSR